MAQDVRRLARYWGKASGSEPGGRAYHSVLAHSLDVAACAFTLIEQNPALRSRLAGHAGLTPDATALTYAAVCALHDIGKIDTRFQRKAPEVADVLRPESAGVRRVKYDHGTQGYLSLEEGEPALAVLMRHLGPPCLGLLRAVCGHHGSFPGPATPDPSRMEVPSRLRAEDETARATFADVVLGFFMEIGAQLPWPSTPNWTLLQQLGGLCAIADWVGSQVDPFRYAPFPEDLHLYWKGAIRKAGTACHEAGLIRASVSGSRTFEALFDGFSPRDVQTLTELVETEVPALVIVEAEMGKGKTEAAFSVAARYLAGVADGLTIALPTQATSNGLFPRAEHLVRRLFTQQTHLALAHGRARQAAPFQRLIQAPLRALDEDAPEASVTCARWLLQRKRILLAQVGVGTIDQMLQAALSVRHQFVRMFALARNVVIIDEVHAYDVYMEELLEHLLAWLGALKVPVILLSATLPSARREALARAWSSGEPAWADDVPVASVEAAQGQAYPLVTVVTGRQRKTLSLSRAASSRAVAVERVAWQVPEDEIRATAARLLVAARRGARVAWIRNTVGDAQQAFLEAQRQDAAVPVHLFHARFRACDRSRVENEVLEEFGKGALSGGRVLIATQVAEQSLDLDFDELHSDLAPIDLLLQRSGRLHRHQRDRPDGFERPRLIVHGPGPDDVAGLRFGASGYVYDPATLWIADQTLRGLECIRIPEDIRALVEGTYHPHSRARLLREGGAHLIEAERRRADEVKARRANARRCCIPTSSSDWSGTSTLDDDEDTVQAFTRDGQSITLLPFWWDGTAGRTLDARSSEAPWMLDASRSDAWNESSLLLEQTLSLPRYGPVSAVPVTATPQWSPWLERFRRFADEAGLGRRTVALPMAAGGDGTFNGLLQLGSSIRPVRYSPRLGLVVARPAAAGGPRVTDEVGR